jgi:hypothetical protein
MMKAIRLLVLLLATASPAAAQQVVFDKPVRAGDLTLFREVRNEKAYYYAPTKPHLATDANGLPQFSFFRWVENVRSGAKEADAREGDGGGIIHALVTFGVTKEELAEAQRDLQRQIPGATIVGPIIPKSGVLGLVGGVVQDPAGTDKDKKIASQVLGMTGNAPMLDGDKAAVSIRLTKFGAKVLWEQFQTPVPDLTFQFEWTIEGFKGPMGGTIEANLDEIVKHDAFAAGVAGSFFGAQIKGAFDELRRTNAIKVTQIGVPDEGKLADMFKTAYDKLVELLFDKASPAAAAAAAPSPTGAGSPGDEWITKAATQLDANRKNADTVRKENNDIKARNVDRHLKREAADAAEKQAKDLQARLQFAEVSAGATPDEPTKARIAELRKSADEAQKDAVTKRQAATAAGPDEALKDVPAEPGFAVMASYELKRSHVTGIYRIDLNKHTSETRVFPVKENVGDLRPLFKSGAFRQVNLDDPLYQQREILAILDGLNAADFGEYVNFVSLRLRKTHESGQLTDDEVRIDRKNFNQEGAVFKLLYGWKGDTSRQRWMDYEYQTVWSFFGGATVETPWKKGATSGIALTPPLQRRSVELKGDPKRLADQGVRAVSVKVFYHSSPDGPEQVKQLTLTAGPNFVGRIDFIAPKDSTDYEYEIAWRLTGNREVTSGRQKTSFTSLDVDELPK